MLMFLRTFIVQPLSRAARRIKIPFSLFFDARFKKGSHSANSFLLLKAVPKLVHGVRSWLHFSIILVGTGTFFIRDQNVCREIVGNARFFRSIFAVEPRDGRGYKEEGWNFNEGQHWNSLSSLSSLPFSSELKKLSRPTPAASTFPIKPRRSFSGLVSGYLRAGMLLHNVVAIW